MSYERENMRSGYRIFSLSTINEEEFEYIFNLYFDRLLCIANSYVSQREDAEEIVQEVFIKLWSKRKKLDINTSNINGYLFKMVKNGCLDYLRKKTRQVTLYGHHRTIEDFINYKAISDDYASDIIAQELTRQIKLAIELLPEKCKNIFIKSRVEELSNKDISDQLHISVKTVENHIGKALKHMRFHLQEYLHLF